MPTNSTTQSFDNAQGAQPSSHEPIAPSSMEAQAMVDQAIYNLGVDPKAATDPHGWRHLTLGTAEGAINVIEWQEGVHFLVVYSTMLRAPEDARLRLELFETLLSFNHQRTGLARFALQDDLVVLAAVRPIQGMGVDEVLDAINAVMHASDYWDEPLHQMFGISMPKIDMDDQTWQGVLHLQRLCEPHTQQVFAYLMERWVEKKGTISTGKHSIGLVGKTSGKSVAGFIGQASGGPIVTLSWDSLEDVLGVLPKDAAAFKKAVPRPERFKTTGSSAHLPVDASFTQEMCDQVVEALLKLDKALARAVPPVKKPLPDLTKWGLNIQVGGATQRNIDELLTACTEPVQQVYVKLIQGWYDTGQALYTNHPDRVYMRLAVDQHNIALCTLWGLGKKRGPRAELSYPLTYCFDSHLEARRRYEQKVAQIPGFSVHNSGARISIEEEFTARDADELLNVLRTLAQDVAQS
jgi:hypothetical protein